MRSNKKLHQPLLEACLRRARALLETHGSFAPFALATNGEKLIPITLLASRKFRTGDETHHGLAIAINRQIQNGRITAAAITANACGRPTTYSNLHEAIAITIQTQTHFIIHVLLFHLLKKGIQYGPISTLEVSLPPLPSAKAHPRSLTSRAAKPNARKSTK